jgi:hypothetical protein
VIFRVSRDGILWKINNPVLETQRGDVEEHQPARIRKQNRDGQYWESVEFIVPFEGTGQHNPAREKDPSEK